MTRSRWWRPQKEFSDDFVCLADRRNRQLKGNPLDLSFFTGLQHIFIAPHGGVAGQVDSMLAKRKLQRMVRLSLTEFSMTPYTVLGSELIVIIPRRTAEVFASLHRDLKIHECPIKLDPVEIWLSWHERFGNSKPHLWLKSLITESLKNPKP